MFDGWKSGGLKEDHIERGGIRIIYSRLGEKADTVIKRIISTERQEWIVITSDRDIASQAWRCGSIPVSSEIFYEKLFTQLAGDGTLRLDLRQAQGEKGCYEEPIEPEIKSEHSFTPKGNPYRPSKKEKAIRRALSKL